MSRNQKLQTMTSVDSTDCAWCLHRNGQDLGEGSHGICEPHSEIEYARYQVSRVPSAIEEDAADRRNHSLFQR